MKAPSYFIAFSTVLACGNAKPNLTFNIEPPPDGDSSCLGVAGFDVTISTTAEKSASGPLLNAAPVLDGSACHLVQPFSLPDVDLDSPAKVTVIGRDSAGFARVEASGQVDNLRGGPVYLQLHGTTVPPAPVLVVHRLQLLGATPLSDVVHISIATVAKGKLSLVEAAPGAYFSVEPAAYAVPANLAVDGADNNQMVTADVTTKTMMLTRIKLNLFWTPPGYYEAR